MRELWNAKRTGWDMNVIAEIAVQQDHDGRLTMFDFLLSTGHKGIDEGIREAMSSAITHLKNDPPEGLAHGQSFESRWRLRATWRMVPPTALLTGGSFNVTPKGIDMDIPFALHLNTAVELKSIKTASQARTMPATRSN